MSMLTSLVLYSLSNNAIAGSPYIQPLSLSEFKEWSLVDKTGSIGSIEIEGTVEVPLYTDNHGNPVLQSFVKSDATSDGDRGDLFRLIPETSIIMVTEDFANRNALDIKVTNKRLIPVPDDFKLGGEIKYVQIPSLDLGGVVLLDVTAMVATDTSASPINGGLALPDLTIGLGSLPASYAIMYSQGVLRISQDGSGLMTEMGATGIPYKSRTILEGTQGVKTLSGANKRLLPGKRLIVEASFGEQTVSTELSFNNTGSSLDRYVDISSDIMKYKSDVRKDWLSASIGDNTTAHNYVTRVISEPFSDGLNPIATLGSDVLSQFDIVVDKTSQTIGLSAHSGITNFQKLYPITLENARAAMIEESPTEETEGSESSDSEEENSPAETALNIAGINGLIAALEMGGSYEEALTQYDLLINDEGEQTDCQLWLNYGNAQVAMGNTDKAQEAFAKSAQLYHSWWDIEINARLDINEAQEKMNEEEQEVAKSLSKDAEINTVEGGWYLSQPETCYLSDGLVASMDLLSGNHGAVEENYRANLDLDDGLARILGNSSLVEGKTELAHEAYRQAIRLEDGPDDRALNRFGLAMVYADQGKWEQANALFMESQELRDDVLVSMLWLENATAQSDDSSARKILQDWADTHPNHAGVRLALLKQKVDQRDGVATQMVSATSETEQMDNGSKNKAPEIPNMENSQQMELSAELAKMNASLSEYSTELQAWHSNSLTLKQKPDLNILMLTFTGDLEEAEKHLQANSVELSSNAELNFAAANLYARQGKTEEAKSALRKAVSLSPEHAGLSYTLR
jgi:tetratricopeptide (TPR) repeat protein